MYIQWIEVSLPPLDNDPSVNDLIMLDKQVNLFIGPNASGKSTILKGIKGLTFWGEDDLLEDEAGPYPIYEKGFVQGYIYGGINYESPEGTSYVPSTLDKQIWSAMPFLYIPATRISLPGMSIFDPTIQVPKLIEGEESLKRLFDTDSGIFYGQYVDLVINSLRQELTNENKAEQLRKARTIGYSCAKSICSEVIRGDDVHPYVETKDDGFHLPETLVHQNLGIITSDGTSGEPLYAGALSSGTQGTLLWIWALALKMAHHYAWQEGWEKKPAILLIDEIENHLHPTWQRRVIPALLEHFPGLQIFATTHSPFVVAGLKAGQVHLLKRENGVVTATTHPEDVIGWTADEILRTMMGVEDPTDLLTIERDKRLRELRGKETLTDAEESELNTLRRQVNEAHLSRSVPVEERESYGNLMQQFLLTRQSDLSQDGG